MNSQFTKISNARTCVRAYVHKRHRVRACIFVYVRVCMRECIMYMCACVAAWLRARPCVCVCVRVRPSSRNTFLPVCVCTNACVRVDTYAL